MPTLGDRVLHSVPHRQPPLTAKTRDTSTHHTNARAHALDRLGLVPRFFDFLSLDHTNNNVYNMRLCCQAVAAGYLPPARMQELRVVPKAGALLLCG